MQSCPLHRKRFGQLNACLISCGGMTGEMGTYTEGKEIAGLTAIVVHIYDITNFLWRHNSFFYM